MVLQGLFCSCNNVWLPEWSNGVDCKSTGASLRRFKSYTRHMILVKQLSKNIEEPDYMGSNLMERLQSITKDPVKEIVKTLCNRAERFNQQDRIIAAASIAAQESGWEIVETLLPVIKPEEAVSRRLKATLNQLKRIDDNFFGSAWNEVTAFAAGVRLGIKPKELKKTITEEGFGGQKLRTAQAFISKESETLAIKKLLERDHTEIVKELRIEAWVTQQTEEIKRSIKEIAPEISKQESENTIKDVLVCMIKFIGLTPGQKIPLRNLRETLLRGRLGILLVNLVAIHCLAFRNSEETGIEVKDTAEDFVATNADSSRVRISQNDSLDEIANFAKTLGACNINCEVAILIIDNDSFVLDGQESNVTCFIESLKGIIKMHPISNFNISVLRASDIINPEELALEWERRNRRTDKDAENSVDEEFEKLQRRTLPKSMKTREFARKVARKRFLVQMSLGASIPILFTKGITLQRAKAHQQATKLFNLGAALNNETPVIITHWKEATKVAEN